jgi:hypothetical protein
MGLLHVRIEENVKEERMKEGNEGRNKGRKFYPNNSD